MILLPNITREWRGLVAPEARPETTSAPTVPSRASIIAFAAKSPLEPADRSVPPLQSPAAQVDALIRSKGWSPEFGRWVQGLWTEVRGRGVEVALFVEAMREVTEPKTKPSVQKVAEKPRDDSEDLPAYAHLKIQKYVSPIRSKRVRDRYLRLDQIASEVMGKPVPGFREGFEVKFGAAPEAVMAIWGVETNFGTYMGDHNVFDALTKLAYTSRAPGRRKDMRGHLLGAFELASRLAGKGFMRPAEMKGSWAGAMGHTQFMPASYLAYCADGRGDGTGDGFADIWNNPVDAWASAASHLMRKTASKGASPGWQKGEAWGQEVLVEEAFFEQAETGLKHWRPISEWRDKYGLELNDDGRPADDQLAAVVAPVGKHGPVFVVYHNFKTFMRYNNWDVYGLSVGILSDIAKGSEGVTKPWPGDELRLLTKGELREVQRLLNETGIADVGRPDASLGPKTRAGVRAAQRKFGQTPDGFPTMEVLEALRDYSAEN